MRREGGFAIVELLLAALIMVVAILAAFGALDVTRRLTLVTERQTTMVHRAERELERIRSQPYNTVAMKAAPPSSANPADPGYYVIAGTPPKFQYDRGTPAATEPFAVDAADGTIAPGAAPWSDGRLSGGVYVYVTFSSDPNCQTGTNCPVTGAYKRVTVAVTINGVSNPGRPVLISTIIADPNSAAIGYVKNGVQNPLTSPSTMCLNAQSVLVPCTNGLQTGSANTWFLYDTSTTTTGPGGLFSAFNTVRQPIVGSHATHPAIAVVNSLQCVAGSVVTGCQNPDLMGSVPPPRDVSTPRTPYCYTNDTGCGGNPPTGGLTPGGRTMPTDVSCNTANPWATTDNHKGAFWVTNAVAADTTLTGAGGMTLYAATSTGGAASVTICLGVYVLPANVLGLIALPPARVGVVSYTTASFPTVAVPVSFNFNLLAANTTYLVAAGNRIGVRVWVDASSSAGVTMLYDHPSFASALQLNTQ